MTNHLFANGMSARALGLSPDDGFWLAMVLLVIALLVEILLVKSINDRRVLGEQPVIVTTIILATVSILCFVGGILILLY